MKRTLASLPLVLPLAFAAMPAHAVEQLIPAGSVITCTVAEPKVSSQTQNIGDPVLCQVSHFEKYGRAVFPYGSYLEGTFVEYKDPGHFVGKGWMELKFDKLVVGNDTIVPLNARVVATPNNPVDKEGRILGKGHATKDVVTWLIPVLWPIDLINLPRRGPRPVLKAETRLTLKVLDDVGIPSQDEVAASQPALVSRGQVAPAPIQQAYQQPVQQYQPQPQYQQQQYAPAPQAPTVIYQFNQPAPAPAPAAPVVIQMQAPAAPAPQPVYVYPQAPPPPPPAYFVPYRPYRGYYGPY